MSNVQQFRADIQAVADAVAKARREAETEAEQVLDLSSLEGLVARITAASTGLSAVEKEELRGAVLLLVSELDELRELVRSEHQSLRRNLEGAGTRQSAAAAYGQVPPRRR